VVYRSPLFVLREDRVVQPDGVERLYPVVEMRPAVGIVAINDDDMVALVRQWATCIASSPWRYRRGCEPGE
jgi:hypothetical protein